MCNRGIQIKEKYSHYEIRICKRWENGCFEKLLSLNQLQYIPSQKCFVFSKCHLDVVLYILGHLVITKPNQTKSPTKSKKMCYLTMTMIKLIPNPKTLTMANGFQRQNTFSMFHLWTSLAIIQ